MASDQPPVSIWKSVQMRTALVGVVVGIFGMLHALGVKPVIFGWDLSTFDAEKIVDVVVSAATIIGAIFFAKKRVEAGKDPANPLPPIESPVATVSRITKADTSTVSAEDRKTDEIPKGKTQ